MPALLMVLLLAPVWAQSHQDVHVVPRKDPAEAAPRPADTYVDSPDSLYTHGKPLRVDVDLVLVPVNVTDSMNHPVTGLEKENFALFEGEQRQQIRYFSSEDAPISIGVLLDLSRSMSNKIDDAREALGEFFRNANPEDDYFVITFSDRPEVLADVSQSIGSIQAKLASATPAGHTALLDSIYLGLAKLRHARYQRRALLIISDGGDNHSRYRSAEIKRMVEEADVEIYAIGIFDRIFKTPEEWAGKKLLTEITEATGGRTLTLSNPRELPRIAAAISLELRNQYVLGYRSSNPQRDGKWRKIRLQVTPTSNPSPAVPPLHVSFRRGYLSPGE